MMLDEREATPVSVRSRLRSPRRPSPGSRKWRLVTRLPDPVLTFIIVVIALVTAEFVAARGWLSPLILPAPSAVWAALLDGFSTGVYYRHLASTAGSAAGGFLVASVLAIVLAGLLSAAPRLERVLSPLIYALQNLPKIAVAPIVILLAGFGNFSKVLIVILATFFPVFVNALQGLKIRDRTHYELFSSLGATKVQEFRHLRLPASLPYIVAGLNVGTILALIGAIVAEFVGSQMGLGYYMIQQRALFNVPAVYAVLLMLMLLGLLFHGAIRLLERRLVFWADDVSNVAV